MAMQIITNNKPRELIYGYQLTEKEKQDFDWLNDIDSEQFVQYQGMIIHIGEFVRLSGDSKEYKAGYHSVYGLNAFCGVLVKLLDNDRVIVGKVLC